MQGKSLAFSTTKSGDFAELNAAKLRQTREKGNYARSNPEIQSVLLILCQVAVEIHSDILLNENHQLIHDALQSTPEDISFHLEH